MATVKANTAWGQRIAVAALQALVKPRDFGVQLAPNYCLNFTRIVVEKALGLGSRGFYKLVQGEDSNPSAKELEVLLRTQYPRWVIPRTRIQPGDLVFWNNLPPAYGHVGIAVMHNGAIWVAQNTTVTNKGIDYEGALRLVLLADHAKPTTIIRIGG